MRILFFPLLCIAAFAQEITLKPATLADMPHQTVAMPDEKGAKHSYEAVPLADILKKSGFPAPDKMKGKALSTYVYIRAHDGYTVVFSAAELDPNFGNLAVYVADKRDGEPMAGEQGPLRLIVPSDKKQARSVRMLESVEIVQLRK